MSQEAGIPQTSYMLITIRILFQDPLDICDVEKDLISLTLFQLWILKYILCMLKILILVVIQWIAWHALFDWIIFSIFSGLQ